MDIKTAFGENLKFYRKGKNLTQEELSEMTGISVKHLSAIERGHTFVSADLLEKLAVSLNVPVFYLFANSKELYYNEMMLRAVDKVIENKLLRVIEEIKIEIRS